MIGLSEIKAQASSLDARGRADLASYLIASLPSPEDDLDDEEVLKRVEEMESGRVQPLSHEDFVSAVTDGWRR